jgi:RNA polymerase sigma-70 factor (ECF subfamily)
LKNNKRIDADLVEQFQSGNAHALTELVKRWHKQFCEKAYWIVRDADQSKDIAQDSWNTIIAKIQDLKDPHSFGGWSMRIVYSKSLDVMREASKKRIQLEVFERELIQESGGYQDNSQLKKDLLKAVKRLSDHQQVVLKLFYTEAYSLQQISDILDISVGTAKSRLFHAREKLKGILKKKENY